MTNKNLYKEVQKAIEDIFKPTKREKDMTDTKKNLERDLIMAIGKLVSDYNKEEESHPLSAIKVIGFNLINFTEWLQVVHLKDDDFLEELIGCITETMEELAGDCITLKMEINVEEIRKLRKEHEL